MSTLHHKPHKTDTLLQKLLQSWDSSCLDVQFVHPEIHRLQCKPGTNQDIPLRAQVPARTHAQRGSTTPRVAPVRVRARLHVYSPMSHNAAQCPIMCKDLRIYVYMCPLMYTCHHLPSPAPP